MNIEYRTKIEYEHRGMTIQAEVSPLTDAFKPYPWHANEKPSKHPNTVYLYNHSTERAENFFKTKIHII
jgi:hypothetical protein